MIGDGNPEETRLALANAGPIANAALYNNGKALWDGLVKSGAPISPIICTSLTRPPSPYQGQLIFQTDTNEYWSYNGSYWLNIQDIEDFKKRDHGRAKFYSFSSGTLITYAAVEPNTTIYSGNNNVVLTTGASPERGTFSSSATTYYASKPISLVAEGENRLPVPATMSGTLFGYFASRSNPIVYRFWSPYSAGSIRVYDNVANGIGGNPTTTLSISQNGTQSYTTNNINLWQVFVSTVPVCVTVAAEGTIPYTDQTIVRPAGMVLQTRRNVAANDLFLGNTATRLGIDPVSGFASTIRSQENRPVFGVEYADGAGGAATSHMASEYASNTYAFGNAVSDYCVSSVYPNNTVLAQYWNGSQWVTWDTHYLNGSIFYAHQQIRNGTNGPGVNGSGIISGGAANMAGGANLWRWVGARPFICVINDTQDDELYLSGWMTT